MIFISQFTQQIIKSHKINNKSLLALGGIAKKEIIFCNEAGKWIKYNSDELGFRNPQGVWNQKY